MAKRNFKPVDAGASIGSITFISPSRLAEEKKTGVVLAGTFVESLASQFSDIFCNPNPSKKYNRCRPQQKVQ